jgi:hypothetical protein
MRNKVIVLPLIFILFVCLGLYSQDKAEPKHKFEKTDIEGKIVKIYEFPMMSGYSFKLAANIMVDKDEYTVFLGPKWIFESLKVELAVNDPIKVTGFKYSRNGKNYFVATELTKGEKIVTLPQKHMKKEHSGYKMRKG